MFNESARDKFLKLDYVVLLLSYGGPGLFYQQIVAVHISSKLA